MDTNNMTYGEALKRQEAEAGIEALKVKEEL